MAQTCFLVLYVPPLSCNGIHIESGSSPQETGLRLSSDNNTGGDIHICGWPACTAAGAPLPAQRRDVRDVSGTAVFRLARPDAFMPLVLGGGITANITEPCGILRGGRDG
jgi:hypothetical protein